jgi:hypothetical protein
MSADQLFAESVAEEVKQRFLAGAGYLRLPLVSRDLAVAEVVAKVRESLPDLQIAVFTDDPDVQEDDLVTFDVAQAVSWRDASGDLFVIGDLEQSRAAGLKSIPQLADDAIRGRLLLAASDQARSAKLKGLLVALASMQLDPYDCAEYLAVVDAASPKAVERARRFLWVIGLFPDDTGEVIDGSRLTANRDLVREVQELSRANLQRLINGLEDKDPKLFRGLRKFSRTGKKAHLKDLSFEAVKDALHQTRLASPGGTGERGGEEIEKPLPEILDDREVTEKDFLDAVDDWGPEADGIALDGVTIDWESNDISDWFDFLTDPSKLELEPTSEEEDELEYPEKVSRITGGYVSIAGGSVLHDGDEVERTWNDLSEIRAQIVDLEEVAGEYEPGDLRASDAIEDLLQLRARLAPYIGAIPGEGVRLFASAPELAGIAGEYIDACVGVYKELELLKEQIPREYESSVVAVANQLTLFDVSVSRDSDGSLEARLLPLHPVVIEPRLQAAEGFRGDLASWDALYETVRGSLDPGNPVIAIVVGNEARTLGFSRIDDGLPVYADASPVGSPAQAERLVLDVTYRYLSSHDFARLGLSIVLVDPDASLAARVFTALVKAHSKEFDFVRLGLLVNAEDASDVQTKIDEARERLESGDRDSARVKPVIRRYESSRPESSFGSESPHLVFLFDEAENTSVSPVSSSGDVVQGSVVSEWTFTVDPTKKRPVIKPAAQGRLLDLAYRQSYVGTAQQSETARLPLLAEEREQALSNLAARVSWLVLVESTPALSAPESLGDAYLLGRLSASGQTAFVYSDRPDLLIDPVERYISENAWINPGREAIKTFLIRTVRRSLPEGLLSFFSRKGPKPAEDVLGQLGVAAVLASLQEEGDDQLVMSFDTAIARRWLSGREGNRRADLFDLIRTSDGWKIVVAEVKARSGDIEWHGSVPDFVHDACEQAQSMKELLEELLGTPRDQLQGLARGRLEIIKRQVFLEALQQWDELRTNDWKEYVERIKSLAKLFQGPNPNMKVTVEDRVYLVSLDSREPEEMVVEVGDPPTTVRLLGSEWMKKALGYSPDDEIELPVELLDVGESPPAGDTRDAEPRVTGGVSEQPGEESHGDVNDHGATGEADAAPAAVGATGETEWSENADEIGRRIAQRLRERDAPFKKVDVDEIIIGPSVVQVPFEMLPGKKLNKLQTEATDLARDLGVETVRIDNMAGRPLHAVIEIPRANREIPDITTLKRRDARSPNPELALGVTFARETWWEPLADLPHLLVAGTTGSGKSVFVRSILWQMTFLYEPDEIDLVLIDAKGMRDYSDFKDAAHFKDASDFHLGPQGGLEKLERLVDEVLPERISVFNAFAEELETAGPGTLVRDLPGMLDAANEVGVESPLRPLLVVVDEFNELAINASDRKKFDRLVTSFVQRARAVGGHLIAATQRPSTDVVTGTMKSNFARMSLRVQSNVDSRVILDESGAEALLPMGDMLFRTASGQLVRLQGFKALGPYRT